MELVQLLSVLHTTDILIFLKCHLNHVNVLFKRLLHVPAGLKIIKSLAERGMLLVKPRGLTVTTQQKQWKTGDNGKMILKY